MPSTTPTTPVRDLVRRGAGLAAAALAVAALAAPAPADARVLPDDGHGPSYVAVTSTVGVGAERCPVHRLGTHLVRCDHLTGGVAAR